jgi:outer membrane protein
MHFFKPYLFLALLFFIPLTAENTVEIRGAAFYHSSKLFREIYGSAGPDYQVQLALRYPCLEFWAHVDWFSKHGKSVGFNDSTRVNIVNYALGLSYLYRFNCQTTLYLGAGPCIANIWLKNQLTDHSHETVSKTTLGGLFKVGFYYNFTDCFFIDLFVDYVYQPAHFHHKHHKHIDIGGVKPGIGLGIIF